MLLAVLIMAPIFSFLMHLALSRVNEFNADIDAAKLADDSLALASAFAKNRMLPGWLGRKNAYAFSAHE